MGDEQAAEAEIHRRIPAPGTLVAGESGRRDDRGIARLAFVASTIALALFLLALASWYVRHIIILTFLAVLLALLFTSLGDRLHGLTGLPRRLATLLAGLAVTVTLGGALVLFLPVLGEQVGQLLQRLPEVLGQLRSDLGGIPWVSRLIDQVQSLEGLGGAGGGAGGVVAGARTAIATASEVAGGVFFVLFAAAFFAVDPALYRNGFLQLVPRSRRATACDVIDEMGRTLRAWLRGELLVMTVVGVVTGLGLWLIGVPLPFALGVTAGLLNIIPFLGPVIAAVPAVLLASSQGVDVALWTLGLFVAVQQIEGNILVPLVQRQAVSTPPVLVLFTVFAMGTLFGLLGALVATPTVALVLILARRLYVEPVADQT